MSDASHHHSDRPTKLTESLLQSTGGYELVFSALIMGFAGYGLDQWAGTAPVFVLAFSFAGFLGAACLLYYRFKFQIRLLQEETANTQNATR